MIPTRAMLFGRPAAFVLLGLLVAHPAPAEVVNRIVATVDGDPITWHEVQRYGEDRHAHGVTAEQLLQAVITDHILEKEVAARKITARREDIDKYIQEVRDKNKMSDEQFTAALKQQGMTPEQFRARVKVEIERTQLMGQELRGNSVAVTDEQIKEYYDAHPDDFASRSAVTVRDIFFAFQQGMTRQDAARLVEQAKAVKRMADDGAPFDELARRFSQGPGADHGGLVGTFKRGELDPMLEEAAFVLPPGEISPPLPTPGGVHLIKVEAVQTENRIEFEQVKEQIRQLLANQALDQRFRDWISKNLRERHHVEVLN